MNYVIKSDEEVKVFMSFKKFVMATKLSQVGH